MTPFLHILSTVGLFAGLVAIGATVAVERMGGRLGGILASMPTTIVPACIGMALASDVTAFQTAMAAVPLGMLVDAAFLWSWRVLPRRLPGGSLTARLALMSVLSLALWFALALGFVRSVPTADALGLPPLAVGTIALGLLIGAGVAACLGMPAAPKGSRAVAWPILLGRGVLAGLAVSVAVLITQSGAPLIGGIASVFPAIFLTTMVSLWLAQGEAVPIGAVGPIILGSSSVGAFSLIAALSVPAFGIAPGVLMAWLGAVCLTSLPAGMWLTRAERGTSGTPREAQ